MSPAASTEGLIEVRPDYATPPGKLLDAVLERLGLTQAELAERTGLSAKHINQIIKHGASVSPATALSLELATGVATETWTRMEADYRALSARADRRVDLGQWTSWLNTFRPKELRDRHLIDTDSSPEDQVEQLLRFFGVSTPSSWDRVWQPSLTRFRRSPSFVPEQPATTVWLRIGQLKAATIRTRPYDPKALMASIGAMRELTRREPANALVALPELCSEVGVAVVFASEIQGCRASGATWWATPDKAVILLSDRGKREDRLWFSYFHELGHLLKHAKRDTFLDQTKPDDDDEFPPWDEAAPTSGFIDDDSRDSALEREADEFAAEALIPASFRGRIAGARTKLEIESIADDAGVSPGVVAGRWQFEHGNFTKFNDLRRKLPAEIFGAPPPVVRPNS